MTGDSRTSPKYELRRAGSEEDSDSRLWSPSRRPGVRGAIQHSWTRYGAGTVGFCLLAAVAALVWLTPDALVEARLELAVTTGSITGEPGSESEVSAIATQVRDIELIEQVVQRMRLYRSVQGDTVATRTAIASQRALEALSTEAGDAPGSVRLTYSHRNATHAADFLNTLAELFVAQRGSLQPRAMEAQRSRSNPSDDLASARRQLSDFLRLNPTSRIEPQRRQNEARITELRAEIEKIDQALESMGQGEASRSLALRRKDFSAMLQRHQDRLAELDRTVSNRRQLENQVQIAEKAVAAGAGAPAVVAPIAPTTTSSTHVTVAKEASSFAARSGTYRDWVAGLLLALGAALALGLTRYAAARRRTPAGTAEIAQVVGAPVLIFAEEKHADVS